MNKIPYTVEKPKGIVTYKHEYGNCPEYPIKIYKDHIVMSRKGFQDLLYGLRNYHLLDDIYKTVGKIKDDGTVVYASLYPTRKVGE